MGANPSWAERQVLKLVWKGMVKRMPKLKRWGPLLGVAILVGATVARAVGREDVAQSFDLVGSLTGLGAQSPVSATEITGAVAAAAGLILKIVAVVRGRG